MNFWKKLLSPGIRLTLVDDYIHIYSKIVTTMRQIVLMDEGDYNIIAAVQAKIMKEDGTICDEVMFPINWDQYEYTIKKNIDALIGKDCIAVKMKIVTNRGQNEEILVVCDDVVD